LGRANRLQVVTQDSDFAVLAALGLIDLIKI
jgi:predicted nuclease of predicted toxin-antitoxin system